MPISSLMQLQTPHAVVDKTRARANIARVAEYARRHQLGLRPHIKTHKDPDIARLQLEAGATGVTCATAREAEVMSAVTSDILVAYPPVDPHRITRLLELPARVQLKVALDSLEATQLLAKAAAQHERSVGVLVEIDLGARRTGVSSEAELLGIADAISQASHLEFLGILVFPGHVHLPAVDPKSLSPKSRWDDSALLSSLATLNGQIGGYVAALAARGFRCSIVSGGNTPSLFYSHLVSELTEIRPGTYVYSDRDIASQGVFTWDACAYSILTTVVSTAVSGQAVIDAGTKSIAKEPLAGLSGYGALLDRPEVVVASMSEEHGILDLSQTDFRPKVGDRVRVVPNHVCVSVHLQDKVAFVDSGDLTVRSVAARGR